MKTTVKIVRILLGALFIFGAITYFAGLVPEPELSGELKVFNEGLAASGYLVPLIKAVELVCGLAFILGRFVPLAVILIFPVVVNILLVHIFIAPEGLPIALFVFFASLFLAYSYRSHYAPLFSAKAPRDA